MGIFQSKDTENERYSLQEEIRRQEIRQRLELQQQQALQRLKNEIRQQKLRRQSEATWEHLGSRLSNLHITEQQSRQSSIKEIKRNPQLLENLLKCVGQGTWINKLDNHENYVCVLETLETDSYEFSQQHTLFRKTNKVFFQITHIEKVINPYLYLQFKLKEKEYKQKHGLVQTMKLYHGTKMQNTSSICATNLDWRRNGDSTGHKFGQGVSFSPYSNYATHYGDKKSYNKVMFAVDVLVGECCLGEGNTVVPEGSADTTVNDKGSVYVKYEDCSFYPTYLIHYKGFQRKN